MSDKPAGWYPDPDGENRQRYWDGDAWSEYYTPLAPQHEELRGSATATADYPYLAASRTGAHHDVMVTPTGGGSGWPTPPKTAGDGGQTLEFSGGGRRGSAGRWALIVASVLVVGLVIGSLWWAFGWSSPGDGPTGGPTATTPPPTDGPTTTADVAVGTAVSGEVPEAGLWVGTVSVAADSTLLVDARAAGSSGDLRLQVREAGSTDPLSENDDRGSFLRGVGGTSLDPLTAATLTAGTYEIVVDDRRGQETGFDLTVTAVEEQLTIDTPLTASLADDAVWLGTVAIADDGEYVVDVRGDGADPVLVMIGPDGRQLVSDDRDLDSPDPLIEERLTAGTWTVVITEYFGDPTELTITAGAA